MAKQKILKITGKEISFYKNNTNEYISLTDMARFRDEERTNYIIQNWMRTRSAIEFCGLWEKFNNPSFKGIEFDAFKNESGSNSFTLTPQKWVESTNAIGIISKSGRYGGTFAHKDIAFEFASWISPEFKFYLIHEFQRLKEEESNRLNIEWNFQRMLTKVNYKIHTDAIKENLLPLELNKIQTSIIYSSEADVLNMAIFGLTAKEWRNNHPLEKGNIRDIASIQQLVVLSNLESINALFISEAIPQNERLVQLNKIAIQQMKSLVENNLLQNSNQAKDLKNINK